MKLEQLLEGVPFTLVQGSLDTEVQDIIYDSRKAAPCRPSPANGSAEVYRLRPLHRRMSGPRPPFRGIAV